MTNEEISFHDVFQNIITWTCVILKSNMNHPNFWHMWWIPKNCICIFIIWIIKSTCQGMKTSLGSNTNPSHLQLVCPIKLYDNERHILKRVLLDYFRSTIPMSHSIWNFNYINKESNFGMDNECIRKIFQVCSTSGSFG